MLIRSSMNALRTDPGYDSGRVLSLACEFPEAARYSVERKRAVIRELRSRLASWPSVAEVTSAQAPGNSILSTAAVPLDSTVARAVNGQVLLHYTYVQPNYFRTVGIPLVLGPGFQAEGGHPSDSVVVSESAARALWPGVRPIGRRLRLGATDGRPHAASELTADGQAYEVVGVVRDIRGVEFDGSNSKHVYIVLPDARVEDTPILVRVSTDAARFIPQLDPLLASVDPQLLATASTLDEMLRQSSPFIISTLSAAVASTVGLVALLLALTGIYGTVNYMVAQRTREVGIRMALGALKRNVTGLLLRDVTRPVLLGLLAGLVAAAGTSRLLRGVLYGVDTIDAASFVSVATLFLVVALIAAFAPARRAAAVDPGVALRYE